MNVLMIFYKFIIFLSLTKKPLKKRYISLTQSVSLYIIRQNLKQTLFLGFNTKA